MAKKESCLLILIKMTLMISLLLAGGIVSFFYLRDRLNEYFNRGENIEVPDFRGKSLSQVLKDKPPDFIIETKDEKYDPQIPKDHVISQDPEHGTKVKPNKKMFLTISLGSKQVEVPELSGKSSRESTVALLNAQLNEGIRAYIFSSETPRERIIAQSPPPSCTQNAKGAVDLLISLGSSGLKAPLPNFVGKSLMSAKTSLASLGLKEGKILYKKDPNHAKDQVLSTFPSPFDPVSDGYSIDLLVSSGNSPGNVSASELKRFEISEPQSASTPSQSSQSAAILPPRILLPEGEITEDTPANETVSASSGNDSQKPGTVPQTFEMPEGFMAKEVKFILISREGRAVIYTGVHKPNDHIKVDVPNVPEAKLQIYINNIPIEERSIQ
ncbi:PASTA domain-containing protein [bacterium]|nr:PASTA domain-containing protein [bacterium]